MTEIGLQLNTGIHLTDSKRYPNVGQLLTTVLTNVPLRDANGVKRTSQLRKNAT